MFIRGCVPGVVGVGPRSAGLGFRIERDLREAIGHARSHESGLASGEILDRGEQAIFRVTHGDDQRITRLHEEGFACQNGLLVGIVVQRIAGSLRFAVEREKAKEVVSSPTLFWQSVLLAIGPSAPPP